MIDHYALYDIKELTDRFAITDGLPKGVKPRYNISPTQPAPVLIMKDGRTELQMMNWGLVSQGAKDMTSVFRYKTHNVTSEKVFAKASWDTAVRERRCIIPANGFYMIRSGEQNDAYYFTAGDESFLGFAGIYTEWTDPSGDVQRNYSLLTIESNDTMPLPFARMPVILHRADEKAWLDPNMKEFSGIVSAMRPYEGATLSYRKVSNGVASNKQDDALLIERLR